jgi:uncharacterized membrane protein YbhN (UPF0104 family)
MTDGAMTSPAKTENGPAKRQGRGNVARFLPLVISIALLVWLLWGFQSYALLWRADKLVLAAALALSLGVIWFWGAYKWRAVLRLSGIEWRYREVLWVWIGLGPATLFMPFQTGIIAQAILLRNARRIPAAAAFENIGYDRFLNLAATCGLIVLGAGLGYAVALPQFTRAIVAGAALLLLLFLLDPLIFRGLGLIKFVRRFSRLAVSRELAKQKIRLLFLALIYQSCEIAVMYLACLSLGVAVPVRALLNVYPIIMLLSYVPVSFHGFGTREALVVLLLSDVLRFDQAISASLIVDAISYVAPALFGLFALPRTLRLLVARPKPAQNAPTIGG